MELSQDLLWTGSKRKFSHVMFSGKILSCWSDRHQKFNCKSFDTLETILLVLIVVIFLKIFGVFQAVRFGTSL